MRAKERQRLTACIDAAAGRSDEPLRKRPAAGPGMPSASDGVEHHGRVVSTMRVFAAGDIRGHRRFEGSGCAPVSTSPIRRPCRDARKRIGGNPRPTAVVRSHGISGPMKRDHRHRSMVCTERPCACASASAGAHSSLKFTWLTHISVKEISGRGDDLFLFASKKPLHSLQNVV